MQQIMGTIIDNPSWGAFTTTSDDYADVPVHWPEKASTEMDHWPTKYLGSKTLYFVATTNNLKVQILGSMDGGATFPFVVESEFNVLTTTPVLKKENDYYEALQVQVKPAGSGAHGTLAVYSGGKS